MSSSHPLSLSQRAIKRSLDLAVAVVGLALTWWIIAIAAILATADTGKFGIFRQTRVGAGGRLFKIYKVRTMRSTGGGVSTVTARGDGRITRLGSLLRRFKIDELPQLVNVLRGDMSLVGPRPDVPGFADLLEGSKRAILTVRPGITGPATLEFRDEEELLASVSDPERYNTDVLYPIKVQINLAYLRTYSIRSDLACIRDTVTRTSRREPA